ncbi:hypothetical protein D3C72_1450760 [compost metagenome]
MERSAAIAVAVAVLLAGGEAAACTVDTSWSPEDDQKERQFEIAQWDRSQRVSLARLERRTHFLGGGFRLTYRIVTPLKGDNHPRTITKTIWMSRAERECGYFPPSTNEHLILYSSPTSGYKKYLPWMRWTYTWYQHPEFVTDRRVAISLRSAANRLKSSSQ